MRSYRSMQIDEPLLAFGFNQTSEYSKEGLFLYGPLASNQNPARMDVGVIGTPEGIGKYCNWVRAIRSKIDAPVTGREENKMMWPGFESVFGVEWPDAPFAKIEIDPEKLSNLMHGQDRHQAISASVGLYADAVRRYLKQDESRPPMLWFVVVPEYVFKYGRPQSKVPKSERTETKRTIGKRTANKILSFGSLFIEEMEEAKLYEYELNFHNQLKARILDTGQVLQVVRETTLHQEEIEGVKKRALQDPASVAWNLSTTSFYKTGARPWRVADVREGVCYVGLVFKKLENPSGKENACCGAQMFLSSGEGVVFKGAVGPWYSETERSFHLSRTQSASIMKMIIDSYAEMHGFPPSELFIHGKTEFGEQEWDGFRSAAPATTKLVGVRIKRHNEFKLFRYGQNPVLRGTAMIASERKAYLWTVGYTPRLATYPGREVPNPLMIDIVRGLENTTIEVVLKDIMALTKLNYNNAGFSDGLPVTLRFADIVGEILTSGPVTHDAPLPFKFYI